MQKTIFVADGVIPCDGGLPGYRQELTEAQQQSKSVGLGEIMCSFIPLRYEFRSVVGGPERRLQFREGLIIEAEVGRDEPFFENRRTSKHCHRSPFHLVGRN